MRLHQVGRKAMFQKTCEELMRVFDHFPKHRMKILLDFNANLGREVAFKPTTGNESLH